MLHSFFQETAHFHLWTLNHSSSICFTSIIWMTQLNIHLFSKRKCWVINFYIFYSNNHLTLIWKSKKSESPVRKGLILNICNHSNWTYLHTTNDMTLRLLIIIQWHQWHGALLSHRVNHQQVWMFASFGEIFTTRRHKHFSVPSLSI